jgi:cytochrome c-type protein NapC
MSEEKPGLLRRVWRALLRPSVKFSVLLIFVLGFVSGLVFWGVFSTGLAATNEMEFCISCHEMKDTVYKEYTQTVHYSNRTGVRATCSDCHVPHELGPKLIRKLEASQEVWGAITGYIDTPEKFESHRMELATHEWGRMQSRQSQECRNCHNFEAMNATAQTESNYKRHMQAKADGKTCIDCHKGIAHHLPKEYRDPDEE